MKGTGEAMPKEEKHERTTLACLIEELDEGALNIEASAALRELIAKVNERAQINTKGAKGTLTLTLTVEAVNERGKLEIESAIATKLPKRPRSRDTRWSDDTGALSLGQQRLAGMQIVINPGAAPLRAPTDKAGE